MDETIIFDPLGELLKIASQIEEQRKENEMARKTNRERTPIKATWPDE